MTKIVMINGVPCIFHKTEVSEKETASQNKNEKSYLDNIIKIKSPYNNKEIYIYQKKYEHPEFHNVWDYQTGDIAYIPCTFTGIDITTNEKWVKSSYGTWYRDYIMKYSNEKFAKKYYNAYDNNIGIVEYSIYKNSLVSVKGYDGKVYNITTIRMGTDLNNGKRMVEDAFGNWYEILADDAKESNNKDINPSKIKCIDTYDNLISNIKTKVQKLESIDKNCRLFHDDSITNLSPKKYIFSVKSIIANMAKYIYFQDPVNCNTKYPVHNSYISIVLHLVYMNLVKDSRKIEIPSEEAFYYFEYTKEELRKYLMYLVYDRPDTKRVFSKLNLSYNEIKKGTEVSDPNRDTNNFSSRYSDLNWEDNFIDLDALINNIVLGCIGDSEAAE